MPATSHMMKRVADSIKADNTIFGTTGSQILVGLYKGAVTPGPDTDIADVDPCLNVTEDPITIAVAISPQVAYFDELTRQYVIKLKETGSGFLFNTVDIVPRTGTIRGFYIVDAAGTYLYFGNLDTPVPITDADGSVNLGEVTLRFLPGMFE